MAAAAAVTGRLTDVRELQGRDLQGRDLQGRELA
jgi:hypothetical protein